MCVQIQYFEACSSNRSNLNPLTYSKLHIGLLLINAVLLFKLKTNILCLISNDD